MCKLSNSYSYLRHPSSLSTNDPRKVTVSYKLKVTGSIPACMAKNRNNSQKWKPFAVLFLPTTVVCFSFISIIDSDLQKAQGETSSQRQRASHPSSLILRDRYHTILIRIKSRILPGWLEGCS